MKPPPAVAAAEPVGASRYMSEKFMMLPTCGAGARGEAQQRQQPGRARPPTDVGGGRPSGGRCAPGARAAFAAAAHAASSAAAAHHGGGEDKVQLVEAPVGPGGHVANDRGAHADDLRQGRRSRSGSGCFCPRAAPRPPARLYPAPAAATAVGRCARGRAGLSPSAGGGGPRGRSAPSQQGPAHLLEQDLEGELGVEGDPVLPALPVEAALLLGLLLLGLVIALAVVAAAAAAAAAVVVVAGARRPAIASGRVQLELLVVARAASAAGPRISTAPRQLGRAPAAAAGPYRNARRSPGRAGAARTGRSVCAAGLGAGAGPTPRPAPSWARTSWAIVLAGS
jgi:hypothetical protein